MRSNVAYRSILREFVVIRPRRFAMAQIPTCVSGDSQLQTDVFEARHYRDDQKRHTKPAIVREL
jgi:hypothetical protein